MTSADVISTYEYIARLTSEMVIAARTSNWDALTHLEDECAYQSSLIEQSPTPALTGASRVRKFDLLKQILANDRAIREITEPWMAQMDSMMHVSPKHPAASQCALAQ